MNINSLVRGVNILKKFLILALLTVIGFMSISNNGINEAQTISNSNSYRAPVVGIAVITRLGLECGEDHEGRGQFLDISTSGGNDDEGVPIYSMQTGTVRIAGIFDNYRGGYALVDDGIVAFEYMHMAKVYVQAGQSVSIGDLIGLMGDTGASVGAHLHLGSWYVFDESPYTDLYNIPGFDVSYSNPCGNSGTVMGDPLPNNPFANCEDFYNQGIQNVYIFDHSDCRGNYRQLTDNTNYYLSDSIDHVRSLSIPAGSSVYISNNPLNADDWGLCHSIDMWNLDIDYYEPQDITAVAGPGQLIGWNNIERYQQYNPLVGVNRPISWSYDLNGSNLIHFIRTFDNPNCEINGVYFPDVFIDVPNGVFVSSMDEGIGGANASNWLLEFSKYNSSLYNVEVHTRVDTPNMCEAHRVLVDGSSIGETTTNEQYITWNTYGWADGDHSLEVQCRRTSDNGSWSTALSYSENFYLSPNRNGTRPCDGSDGIQLNSGNDCIILTQSYPTLDQIGWDGRYDVYATVRGSYEAWIYDNANYDGAPRVVSSGQTISVGSNVSSIDLRSPSPTPVPPPDSEFLVDANTMYLFPLNEGSGVTTADMVSSFSGSLSSGVSWIAGRYGSALHFPNPTDGRGLTTAPINICPMTVEFWVKPTNDYANLMGQMHGGGNTGLNKWLITLNGRRLKLEIWTNGSGSQWITSPNQLILNQWNYVMFTYDCATTAMLYLDNQFMGQLNIQAPMNPGSTTLEIGSAEGYGRCNCDIDDVRISNIVRVPQLPATSTPTNVPTVTPLPTATVSPFNSGIVQNGSFELIGASGFATGWSNNSYTNVFVNTNSVGNHGTNSLNFTPSANYSNAVSAGFAVNAANTYQWSMYLNLTSGSGEFGYYVDEYDANWNWISGQWFGAEYSSFVGLKILNYKPTSGSVVNASLQYYMQPNSTFSVYVDSVVFLDLGVVATATPLPTAVPTITPIPPATSTLLPTSTVIPFNSGVVQNGSFESIDSNSFATGWANNGYNNISIDVSANGNHGLNSMRFVPSANYSNAVSAGFAVNSSANYLWTTYVRTSNGSGEFGYYVDEYDANWNWISGQWFGAEYGDAINVNRVLAYTPSSSNVVNASLQYYSQAGTSFEVYIDSVSLFEVGINPTSTPTSTNVPIVTSTPVPTQVLETELLDSAWNLSGTESQEEYQSLNGSELMGMDTMRITFNTYGSCLLSGNDDNSIIINQNGWNVVKLTNYGQNCYDGWQTISVPLSDFFNISGGPDLDTTQSVGSLHIRIWLSTPFVVDVSSITVLDDPIR